MSIAAISWVFKQEIKPSSLKFVLVALADCADDHGICWPSIEHITETTCQDRKTVIKSLDDLESRGWLVDTGKRMGRTNQVKVYRLTDAFFKTADTKDCAKSTENGTINDAPQKQYRSSAETVPFFPAKSTENGIPPTPPYRADPSLEPSCDPSEVPARETKAVRKRQKPAVTLAELSVDHIADWLAEKRAQGKYARHDEHFILEYFKNYCESRGKTYDNYIAALRNAFTWRDVQPGISSAKFNGRRSGNPALESAWTSAAEQLIAEDRESGHFPPGGG